MDIFEVRNTTDDEMYFLCGFYSTLDKAKKGIAEGATGDYCPEDYENGMNLEVWKHTLNSHESQMVYEVWLKGESDDD